MTVYAIAQFTVTDRAAYRRCQSSFADVFRQFDGELLVADEAPTVEEGNWGYQKVILMSFPDGQALRTFADSPEYRTISVDRQAGTEGVVLIAHGLI